MILIYGPAGVGKSTQGRILAEKMGRKWLSAGQIIRDSGEFQEWTRQGKMIDERILVNLIRREVEGAELEGKRVVFDGQPGSDKQIEYWEEAGLIGKIEKIIVLRLGKEELMRRLAKRGREDDRKEVWEEKISYFEQKIDTFLRGFEQKNISIMEIGAEGEIEEVTERIMAKIRA